MPVNLRMIAVDQARRPDEQIDALDRPVEIPHQADVQRWSRMLDPVQPLAIHSVGNDPNPSPGKTVASDEMVLHTA